MKYENRNWRNNFWCKKYIYRYAHGTRSIEPEKLEKGLGLLKMTLPDVHQDAVVFWRKRID
jgi:hypothetical protein